MERDWTSITYMLEGSRRQMDAYHALLNLGIFSVLGQYSPVLAGTMPLDIDTEQSDLDIICEVQDLDAFEERLTTYFGKRNGFTIRRTTRHDLPTVVANFTYASFPIEVFGQPRPVREQNAYRHMVVEARLLAIGGEKARDAIRDLKQNGMKTEPAFAQYFGLQGDPYQTLLDMSDMSDEELRDAVSKAGND
jgi:hypothetical protein